MQVHSPSAADVVSLKTYARILTSPHLGGRILPEGLRVTPYEILDYEGTLILSDAQGGRAVFRRTQQIRFLQEGVAAILDHFWGDGVSLTDYANTAGQLADSFSDGGRHHLAIDLARPMHRGEQLAFDVERTALASFSADDEWLETTIDHPIHRLGQRVIFPADRPCQHAELATPDGIIPLQPVRLGDGRTALRFTVPHPKADTPYLVRWHW
jgi:hypothetical protein